MKVAVGLALLMDRGIGGDDGRLQRDPGIGDRILEVRVRNRLSRDLAGEFADSMSAHSIGDQKQVPAAEKVFFGLADLNG